MQKKMRKSKKKWIVVSAATAGVLAAGSSSVAADSVAPTNTEDSVAVTNTVAESQSVSDSSQTSWTQTQMTETGENTVAPTTASTASADSEPTAQKSDEAKPATSENQVTATSTVENRSAETGSSQAASTAATTAVSRTVTAKAQAATLGLNKQAYELAKEAGLDLTTLTDAQKAALNRVRKDVPSNSGTLVTYKDFEDIAKSLIDRDPRYAIPYFNASQIQNMPAATTRSAQTGQVADLDVWDSWPVQDAKTGHIINWNGYQLVIAMMGLPHENDQHIYLLYNKYGDNNFANWKNAGSIFGYGLSPLVQQWSGSATVNSDGSIQLYYTHVDTSDNSNNQKLATATLNLLFDDKDVRIKSVTNNRVLTPNGGDGYFYQSYAQWTQGDRGFDNIAMRDPHIVEDEKGNRYLVFEASTGMQNYQGENQIYNWNNYGGDAAYNVKSLFNLLENEGMYKKAAHSNAAIGIVRLAGNEKQPYVAQYYTPLISSPMVSDELERPNVVKLGDKYYLFTTTRLTHASNHNILHAANNAVGDNVLMLGYVSDSLIGGYKPLNGSGVVLTATVPADWRTATYSYYAVPVEGRSDLLLVTSYMTNRSEVAGPGKNSTMSPSFLIQVLADGQTRVLAYMTEQGDWIWDETSQSDRMMGDENTSRLPGEDFIVDWSRIGYYSYGRNGQLKPIYQPKMQPTQPVETPEKPTVVPTVEKKLPNTGTQDSNAMVMAGATVGLLATLGTVRSRRKKN